GLSVKSVAETVMREIIGSSTFELSRTQGRGEIQSTARDMIQSILDTYQTGIFITNLQMQKVDPPQPVLAAFRDVQAARADKERTVNEAQAYYNQITQRAEGKVQQKIKEAEAYKEEKISLANGEAQRFIAIYDQYAMAKNITTRRIYLESMEKIMKDMNKVLVGSNTNNPLPYLSVNELLKPMQKSTVVVSPYPSPNNEGANP
ncbi:MAG: FtsH protease activity modulator HflK, partial [Alphaproteobacteria bacterium]|nr:FtsH protease activity modulator HflK [Alphaproteobacteria bacterium]